MIVYRRVYKLERVRYLGWCGSVSSRSLENCAFHADLGKLEIPLAQQQIFAVVGIAIEARRIGRCTSAKSITVGVA